MARHESDFGPFNASEPVLPWQDPDSEVYDDLNELHEAPRASSVDNVTATENEEDAEIAALLEMLELERQRLIEKSNEYDSQGSTTSQESESPRVELPSDHFDNTRAASPKAHNEEAPAKERASRSVRASNRPTSTSPSACPYRKSSRLWRALPIFMFMLVASRVGSCVYQALTISKLDERPGDDHSFTNPYRSEDAAICRALVEDRLSGITTPDSPQHADAAQRITSWMEKRVYDDFARTPEELGIDVRPLAELALGALSIDISTVSAFPDSDEPHASAYTSAQALSIYEMYFDFQDNARRYLRDNGLSVYTNDGALNDEQKTQLCSYFDRAFSSSKTKSSFVTFELTMEDGDWILEENEFSDGFRHLLLLPGPL